MEIPAESEFLLNLRQCNFDLRQALRQPNGLRRVQASPKFKISLQAELFLEHASLWDNSWEPRCLLWKPLPATLTYKERSGDVEMPPWPGGNLTGWLAYDAQAGGEVALLGPGSSRVLPRAFPFYACLWTDSPAESDVVDYLLEAYFGARCLAISSLQITSLPLSDQEQCRILNWLARDANRADQPTLYRESLRSTKLFPITDGTLLSFNDLLTMAEPLLITHRAPQHWSRLERPMLAELWELCEGRTGELWERINTRRPIQSALSALGISSEIHS